MITHLQLVDELLIASIVAIWLGTIRWAYTDARARIRSRALVRCATVVTAVPMIGLLIYLTVRPPDRLSELRQLEMEMRTLEVRLRRMGRRRCPECSYELRSDFLRCPRCTAPLRHPCVRCHRPLELSWATCPFCDADQNHPAAAAEGDAGSTVTDFPPAGGAAAGPRSRTSGRPPAGGSGAPRRAAVPGPGSNRRPRPTRAGDGVSQSGPRRVSGPSGPATRGPAPSGRAGRPGGGELRSDTGAGAAPQPRQGASDPSSPADRPPTTAPAE